MSVVEFFRQVKLEILRIVWPTRREVVLTSVSVCVLLCVLAVFFLLVDWGLSSGIAFILRLGSY